uniref:Conserved oligomeric Golgi complex subunit 8 n=1 Tax=Globisporangium ultimum (strain ATCC 200006 / CBS 805.95 / DAOM BR144) TaxID=431595 RepID=K3WGL4_GLOUD
MATRAVREYTLEELRKEPWRLQIQTENAAEQLRNLVLKNYHLFIQSNQCSTIVKDDLTALNDETNEIIRFLPELKAHCAAFQKDVASVVAKHGDIQFVFEHYLQLTELLDIPQLLEVCVHNEQFESALDVIQFANETFETREDQATPNFVIATLVREVAQMTRMMREKLLQKLREDLPLAFCVRIVGYIRRLDALMAAAAEQSASSSSVMTMHVGTPEYEKQLKDEFLGCRNVWLSSLSRSVSASDPYQYTIQIIDIKRTSWFDMVTQYSAIFGSETVDGKVDPPLCRWATTTVADFIQILMKQLPKIDDFSSLATILEQSLFFGGSLGRVGVDFRAILVVYFEDHVLELMAQQWRTACRDFEENLSAHSLVKTPSSSSSFAKTPLVIASYRSGGAANGVSPFTKRPSANAAGEVDYSPPHALMAFPILAEFTNAILSSLNELRLCTIASLQSRLSKKLQSTLATMLLALTDFRDTNNLVLHAETKAAEVANGSDAKSTTSKKQALTEALQSIIEILHIELLPYLIKCFHRLYPNKSASAAFLDASYFNDIMHEIGLLSPVSSAPETEQTAEDGAT